MTAVLVDSNILLDLLTDDPRWADWSARALGGLAATAQLVINPIIFAEVSVRAATIEAADAAFPAAFFRREPIPWDAAFLAGKAFLAYQRRGGVRRSPLPDFFIGAHAAVAGYRLLTRDAARYRTYFPALDVIAP
ncbi:MAG: type II toxin-antitoxin system VapC family toxin [Paracraurococcus sp.]